MNQIPTPALPFAPWKRSKMHHHGPQPLRAHVLYNYMYDICIYIYMYIHIYIYVCIYICIQVVFLADVQLFKLGVMGDVSWKNLWSFSNIKECNQATTCDHWLRNLITCGLWVVYLWAISGHCTETCVTKCHKSGGQWIYLVTGISTLKT